MKNTIFSISDLISDIYELTPMQEGMLFHYLLDKKTSRYVIQNVFSFNVGIAGEYIQDTLKLLTQRHDVLKTAIMYEKLKKPLQAIIKNRDIEYQKTDLRSLTIVEKDEQIEKLINEELNHEFDLQKDSLVRVYIVYYDNEKTKVIWTMHHIIVDGWCLPLLFGDFIRYHEMLRSGIKREFIEEIVNKERNEKGSYSEYITWLRKQDKEAALDYWRKELNGYEGIADIKPFGKEEIANKSVQVKDFQLRKTATEKLQEYAIKNKITMSTIAETAWGILLQLYNDKDDVVFGKVVSGRNAEVYAIDKIFGIFINTVPCRVNSRKNMTVIELLQYMQCKSNEGIDYYFMSLTDIQEATEQRSDLIKTIFAFENYYISDESQKNLISVEMEYAREETNYQMNVTICMHKNNLCVRIMYDPNKYSVKDIEYLSKRLIMILEQIAEQPNALLEELEITIKEERELILDVFNDTAVEYIKDKTIAKLFEEQVERTPENIALVYEREKITYKEFNAKANQLAWKLREFGVKPNDYVAIIAKRSIELVIGIFGIIKAGGAYVPIDPIYPKERIKYILKDCKPKMILTYQANVETDLNVFDLADGIVYTGEIENLDHINRPDDLLYCIYTSGTTGNPKGVMVENRALYNYLNYAKINYVNERISMPLFTNHCFDLTGTSLFLPTIFGGTLHILPDEDNLNLEKMLLNSEYSLVKLTPQHLKICLESKNKEKVSQIKSLIVGGENFKSSIALEVLEKYGSGIEIHNEYGPTEATIGCCDYLYSKNDSEEFISIGRPISNVQIYIMKGDRLCGIGIPGELCIAGDGLARGYLNKPELMVKKFVKNPFGEGMMYRTGDLAKWRADGNIDCLGRTDDQVKIRGYRVELGEIESQLCKLDSIQDAVVIARDDENGDKVIYGYVVSTKTISVKEIREQLAKNLPDYMVPTHLLHIDKMPLNPNGKIDKRALPEIEVKSEKQYIAPRDEIEIVICSAFKEVLGLDKVGVRDDFFELGGHSLRAIKLEIEVKKFFNNITIRDIYECKTVENLAYFLQTGEKSIINKTKNTKAEKNEDIIFKTEKIIDIVPFNELFYKGCFYNSLFSLFSYYNIDRYKYLINDVICYKYQDKTGLIDIDYLETKSLFDSFKEDNIKFETEKYCTDILEKIKISIDSANPAIVVYDPYYNSMREDVHKKMHLDHSIVINGYDDAHQIVFAIEHKHWENLRYEQLTIPYKDFCDSYYKRFDNDANPPFTYFQIHENATTHVCVEELQERYLKCMLDNEAKLLEGYESLKIFVEKYCEILFVQEALEHKKDDYLNAFNKIINSKQIEEYRVTYLFKDNSELLLSLDTIVKSWSLVRSYLVKYIYSGIYKKNNFIKSKLELEKLLIEEEKFIGIITRLS